MVAQSPVALAAPVAWVAREVPEARAIMQVSTALPDWAVPAARAVPAFMSAARRSPTRAASPAATVATAARVRPPRQDLAGLEVPACCLSATPRSSPPGSSRAVWPDRRKTVASTLAWSVPMPWTFPAAATRWCFRAATAWSAMWSAPAVRPTVATRCPWAARPMPRSMYRRSCRRSRRATAAARSTTVSTSTKRPVPAP